MNPIIRAVRQVLGRQLSPTSKREVLTLRKRISLRRWYAEQTTEAFLLSFPKSGRTWLTLLIGRACTQHFNLIQVNPLELNQLADLCSEMPRILVTHDDDPQWKRPHELVRSKNKYKNKKVILLVRDPRDVVVSSYFQKQKRKKVYDGKLSEYLHEEVGSFDSLLRFYTIWAENRDVPRDFLLVRYEDMRKKPHQELRRVLDFLGLGQVSDGVIEEAVSFASFENMRRMEQENQFNSGRLRPKDENDPESFKTRKGKVGGFAEYLKPEEIEYLNRRMNEKLSGTFGYRA